MRKFRWVPFLIKKLEYGEDMLEKLFRNLRHYDKNCSL